MIPAISETEIKLLEKLWSIQQATGCKLYVPGWSYAYKDIETIEELSAIIETGQIIKHKKKAHIHLGGPLVTNATAQVLKSLFENHKLGKPNSFTIARQDAYMELFNSKIPLGSYPFRELYRIHNWNFRFDRIYLRRNIG